MSDSPPSAPGDPPPKHDYVEDDFSWLVEEETAGAKLSRKMKENPFVPIGCGMTVVALTYGLAQFKRGNFRRSQLAMRMRVVAQGGTLVAILGGLLYTTLFKRTP